MRRKSTIACAVCALLLALAAASFAQQAQQNDAQALYSRGKTLQKNGRQADAAVAFRGACDKGWAQSCSDLGAQYENGTGVTKDAMRAVALYQRACDGNSFEGCTNLGAMYTNGTGVT